MGAELARDKAGRGSLWTASSLIASKLCSHKKPAQSHISAERHLTRRADEKHYHPLLFSVEYSTVSQSRLNEVFVSHRSILLRTLQRIVSNPSTAEDLLQETYLRVTGALSSRAIEHLEPFIFQTARNLALDHLRARRVRDRTLADDATTAEMENVSAPITSLEDATHAKRMVEDLSKSLATLTPRQQRIFSLSRLQGLSYVEIAQQLGVSASTVQKELKLIMAICVAVATRLDHP